MNIFKNLSFSLALLVFVGFAAFAPLLTGDTIGVDKLAEALDSPSSVTFTAKCTNAAVIKSYTDGGNIGNAEGTGAGKVLPAAGSSFLQMTGSGSPVNGLRPARVRSTFAFQVAGAGTLSFNYRAATYGSDDDVLIFYTSDIDDTLFEASGEYWGVRYYDKDAQEYVYDLLENDFFNDGEFSLTRQNTPERSRWRFLPPQRRTTPVPTPMKRRRMSSNTRRGSTTLSGLPTRLRFSAAFRPPRVLTLADLGRKSSS